MRHHVLPITWHNVTEFLSRLDAVVSIICVRKDLSLDCYEHSQLKSRPTHKLSFDADTT